VVRRISLSNSPLAVILALLFLLGALFYFAGAMIGRRAGEREKIEVRIDMVERLMLVGQPWCVEDLEKMRAEDEDASVRDAADAALIAIHAR
jgi:hypothetical protein